MTLHYVLQIKYKVLCSDNSPKPVYFLFLASFLLKLVFSWQQCWKKKGGEVEVWLTGSATGSFWVSEVTEVSNYFPGRMEKRRSWPMPFSADWVMCCSLPLAWTKPQTSWQLWIKWKWSQLELLKTVIWCGQYIFWGCRVHEAVL